MNLEDILEVIGRIFAIIGLVLLAGLLVGLSIILIAYSLLGWIPAIVAFLHNDFVLGIILLIVWILVSGAGRSW